MKEKIKTIILIISICYSTLIIIALLYNLITFKTTIEFPNKESNIQKLNEYTNKLSTLNQNSCTNRINKLIEYSKKTTYNGEVSFKEIYNLTFDNAFSLYKIKEDCNITEEESDEYDLILNYATYLNLSDEIVYNEYMFQYEVKIPDILGREFLTSENLTFKYDILKQIELKMISDLIEISEKKGGVK